MDFKTLSKFIIILGIVILGLILFLLFNCGKKGTEQSKEPKCSVSPTSLVYDTVEVGGSRSKSYIIKNIGGGTLTGTVSGGYGSGCDQYWFVSGQGSYSLAGGESKTVTISFKPTETGYWVCVTNTGSELCRSVSLSGTAVLPFCSVSSDSLNFDTVEVGGSSEKSFTITNNTRTGVTLTGDVDEDWSCDYGYSISSGSGSFSLEPGKSKTVIVRFAPSSSGYKTCTIQTGNDGCGDVICTGTAVPPFCTISSDSLNFDTVEVGGSSEKSFNITNNTRTGATLSGYITSGWCGGVYSIVSGAGSFSLGPGQSKTVTIKFAPSLARYETCAIETGSDACGNVICTGTGVPPCCSVSPNSLNFDTVTVSTSSEKTFTITNCTFSGATLSGYITSGWCDGVYSIVSGSGIFSLGPGQSKSVTVKFSPTSPGYKTCTIETGIDACSDVSCSGTGK
jgi:hypothetical protein